MVVCFTLTRLISVGDHMLIHGCPALRWRVMRTLTTHSLLLSLTTSMRVSLTTWSKRKLLPLFVKCKPLLPLQQLLIISTTISLLTRRLLNTSRDLRKRVHQTLKMLLKSFMKDSLFSQWFGHSVALLLMPRLVSMVFSELMPAESSSLMVALSMTISSTHWREHGHSGAKK